MKKLGLDYETIHEEFPTLIWAQMRGYGEYGPEKDSPGYDAVCWAARGGELTFSVRRVSLLQSLLRHSATTTLLACLLVVFALLCSTVLVR